MTTGQGEISEKTSSHRLSISVRNEESLDAAVFTFKPKVSLTSAKIVESLGSDFMARQLQHLEKQRKNLSVTMSPPPMIHPLYSNTIRARSAKRKKSLSKSITNKPSDAQSLDLSENMPSTTDKCDSEELLKCDNNPLDISPGYSLRPKGMAQGGRRSCTQRIPPESQQTENSAQLSESCDDGILQVSANRSLLSESDRSKTLPVSTIRSRLSRKMAHGDRLYQAKLTTEKATKLRKIFTIQGGYDAVRQSLRRRGWVEKFFTKPVTALKTVKAKRLKVDDDDDDNNDDDDDDDDGDDDDDAMDYKNSGPRVPPWEEEDGIYGIMSRMIKYSTPTFYWVLKRDVVDFKSLSKDQIINHYCRAGSFTTKIGLCINMRNVPWYEDANPDQFFPRCYRICNDEDKEAFVDDFRLTACVAILHITIKLAAEPKISTHTPPTGEPVCNSPTQVSSASGKESKCPSRPITPKHKVKKSRSILVPSDAIHRALEQCQRHISFINHDDIDTYDDPYLLDEDGWTKLITWYYQLRSQGGYFEEISQADVQQCKKLLELLLIAKPQFKMDGTRNVWILKPGAKSRGRGITCYNKLEDMLRLVRSQVNKSEGKYVVQKYIERPLLIYNTKFDIRQWFLVTDWNPLTMYFYQDCYLRFCSQQYTLDNFDEAVHLSNNSIQKHYKNGPRSENLPPENMWSHYQFIDYLREKSCGDKWDDVIYPAMKKAVTCALLATQDHVEYRKASFELYGADFMLTEDYHPWLIEINSSPSMERSTAITAKLCEMVLDDTVKVVVDRKVDKNCDIGRFELAYKQSFVTVPPYTGLHMLVEGHAIRRPDDRKPKTDNSKESLVDLNDCDHFDGKENHSGNRNGGRKKSKSSKHLELIDDTNSNNAAVLRLQHSFERTTLSKKVDNSTNGDWSVPSKHLKDTSRSEWPQMPKLKDFETVLPPVFSSTDNLRKSNPDMIDIDNISKLKVNKSLMTSSQGAFPSKRARRFISRTSVANGYPMLPIPSTLNFDKQPYNDASWDKSSLIHQTPGNSHFSKTILFPLPGKLGGLKTKTVKTIREMKRVEALSNLPLVPYAAVDLEKVVSIVGQARLKYFNVTRQLSEACICPPPKKATSNRQKGIYIHPSGY